jgi:hypothetical protein
VAGGADVDRAGAKGLLLLDNGDGSLQPGSQDIAELDRVARVKTLGDHDGRREVGRQVLDDRKKRIDAIGWAPNDDE